MATVFSPSNQSKTNDNYGNNSSDAYSTGPPISPHVNVPNVLGVVPPPLPPRRRERKSIEFDALFIAQSRQPPDAPQVVFLNAQFFSSSPKRKEKF